MRDGDYQAALDALDQAVDTALHAEGVRLGRRITGTETFTAPEGFVAGVAILRPIQNDRQDYYLAEVLPGGALLRPVLRRVDGRWTAPGSAVAAQRTEAISLGDEWREGSDNWRAARWYARALAQNSAQVEDIRKRALGANAVFRACLDRYDAYVAENPDQPRTARLTEHLLGAREETVTVIRERAREKHGDSEAGAMSVINSLRRSAGTNYQGLVALAVAEELIARRSSWYIHYPPPREYIQSLALRFTPKPGFEVEIDPDIDILIRNAAWAPDLRIDEPVVLLSVKTSLADRAGAAARWKMYFDVATHTCPFADQLEGCAWHEQGLRFAKPDLQVRLQHCLVTANIYKVSSDPRFAEEGELGTAQTKANTFMFDRRYATRVGDRVTMEGWEPLTALDALLVELSDEAQLPH